MSTTIDGTTGVTFPAGGVGNPAGAGVGTTDSQTLTNKTISAASNTVTNIILGTPQASTSGTSIDFTGIPSNAKRITLNLVGVSIDSASDFYIQLGDSGGVESSGYLCASTRIDGVTPATLNATAGFQINTFGSTSTVLHGTLTLTLVDSATFTWAAVGVFAQSDRVTSILLAGSKSTSAVTDRVRLTSVSGTANFDAGKINITYET